MSYTEEEFRKQVGELHEVFQSLGSDKAIRTVSGWILDARNELRDIKQRTQHPDDPEPMFGKCHADFVDAGDEIPNCQIDEDDMAVPV